VKYRPRVKIAHCRMKIPVAINTKPTRNSGQRPSTIAAVPDPASWRAPSIPPTTATTTTSRL
jgi:hypothetical protein